MSVTVYIDKPQALLYCLQLAKANINAPAFIEIPSGEKDEDGKIKVDTRGKPLTKEIPSALGMVKIDIEPRQITFSAKDNETDTAAFIQNTTPDLWEPHNFWIIPDPLIEIIKQNSGDLALIFEPKGDKSKLTVKGAFGTIAWVKLYIFSDHDAPAEDPVCEQAYIYAERIAQGLQDTAHARAIRKKENGNIDNPGLEAVCLAMQDGLIEFACADGARAAISNFVLGKQESIPPALQGQRFLIPPKLGKRLAEIAKKQTGQLVDIYINRGSGFAAFFFPTAFGGVNISGVGMTVKYPDYRRIIPDYKAPLIVWFAFDEIKAAIRRAAIISEDFRSWLDIDLRSIKQSQPDKRGVEARFEVEIAAESAYIGATKTKLWVKACYGGGYQPPDFLHLNFKYLSDAVLALSEQDDISLEIAEGDLPVILRADERKGGAYLQMIMPMSVN